MLKVKDTKNVSIVQMAKMAVNLMEKFECYCSCDFQANAFYGSKLEIKFTIYVANNRPSNSYLKSWPELLAKYYELMEGGK
jgi:hypothetical protein